MTRLIVYIDSEQKVSAYRIKEDGSYSISFNGNEYESELSVFAETVMEELRATPLSKMEPRGGISVLLVSNGATNETIRKIMELLLHDDNEEGMLNVNIQELNVIEAKYFLPLVGNPESPSAKDFEALYLLENNSFIKQREYDELKSNNSKLKDEISSYKEKLKILNETNTELTEFKDFIIKKVENRLSNLMQSGTLCKIDFKNDAEKSDIKFSAKQNQIAVVNNMQKEGTVVSKNSIIARYQIIDEKFDQKNSLDKLQKIASATRYVPGVIGLAGIIEADVITSKIKDEQQIFNVYAKESGRIFYIINNNEMVCDGTVIAIIGKETWTKEDALSFLKQSQNTKKKGKECIT